MGYKADQRFPSEIHPETLAAAHEQAEEPLPPYPGRPYSPETLTLASSQPAATSQESLFMTGIPRSDTLETLTLAGSDPRATSEESLVPTRTQADGKRILLLIYIHGFMGNETSFASFPAHVHSLLAQRVKGTHAVHTKVYPRYKTRNDIRVVRDQFSGWLAPHEGPSTDVILLGHSMGGIVAAEVALMPSMKYPGQMKHRVLGTLNIDVPFLGMHPGIIGAGLSSIFGGNAAQAQAMEVNEASGNAATADGDLAVLPMPQFQSTGSSSSAASSSTYIGPSTLSTPADDPYYNPAFANDLPVPVRKPVDNLFHFVDKHLMKAEKSTDILKAGGKLITQHLQFGGTMAQYTKLDSRYKQLRALEKEPARVRFVNYFSTCSGRPKPPKLEKLSKETSRSSTTNEKVESSKASDSQESLNGQTLSRDSFAPEDDQEEMSEVEDDVPDVGTLVLSTTDPIPEPDSAGEQEIKSLHGDVEDAEASSDDAFEDAAEEPSLDAQSEAAAKVQQKLAALPPLPEEPTAPAEFDPASYQDKDAQKLAKQQHAREVKAYNQAVKDRNTAIKEREKLTAKYEQEILKTKSKKEQDEIKAAKKATQEKENAEKKAAKDKEAAEKKAEKQRLKDGKLQEQQRIKEEKQMLKEKKAEEQRRAKEEKQKQKVDAAQADAEFLDVEETARAKAKKLKTFCLTPPKSTTGQRPDWIPVFVKDADQVTAHCGLFNEERPHYEAFVRQVMENIVDWVDEMEGTLGLA